MLLRENCALQRGIVGKTFMFSTLNHDLKNITYCVTPRKICNFFRFFQQCVCFKRSSILRFFTITRVLRPNEYIGTRRYKVSTKRNYIYRIIRNVFPLLISNFLDELSQNFLLCFALVVSFFQRFTVILCRQPPTDRPDSGFADK